MYFQTLEQLKIFVAANPLSSSEELLILVADQSSDCIEELIDYLNHKSIRFFGGIYAGLLVGSKKKSVGFVVQVLEPLYTTLVFPFLMRCKLDVNTLGNTTALILVDGLSSKMKDLTDTVYAKLGNTVKYIGGGAGFYDLTHRPCIFNHQGLHKDALIVSILPSDIKIAIKHGWSRLAGPFYITKAHENVLSELDSESAFEVYKHIVEEYENVTLSVQDFFTFAKDHPFGLEEDTLDIVRDPIMVTEKNEIVCVANIPVQRELYVLKGNMCSLLAASMEASQECSKNHFPNYLPLLFNCISRYMFMEDHFEIELSNIQSKMKNLVIGALSIGEIASLDNGKLEIHNKSTIIGALEI